MDNYNWKMVVKNGWFEEIKHLYGKDFPWEIRSVLSSWLSRDDSFMSFDINEFNHHGCIFAFVGSLISELELQINANTNQDDAYFFYKQRLTKLYKRVKAQDPMHLFQVIRDTLALEKQRVEELCSLVPSCSSKVPISCPIEKTFAQIQEEIGDSLICVQKKCCNFDQSVPEMSNRFTTLQYNLYILQQYQQQNNGNINGLNNPNHSQIPSMQDLQRECGMFNQDLQCLHNIMVEIMRELGSVHTGVLKELETWRDEQRLVAVGRPSDKKLESIEKWFKTIATCFDMLELQLPVFKALCQSQRFHTENIDKVQEAIDQIVTLRHAMEVVSLVMTQEPKQIVRSGPNVGPGGLLVLPFCTNMMITSVTAVFINSKTAAEYFNQNDNIHEQLPKNSGDLKFGKGGLKVANSRIEYQTMTLSKVSKSSKRGEQFVVEERFWIYFRVIVNWKGSAVKLHTTSLPISVTSHPVQEGKAWTHVLWYNAFPMKSRLQFDVPNEIPWEWLIEAINLKFINLGKGLSDDQKDYLKERLFTGRDIGLNVSTGNKMVSKSRFCCDTFATGKVDPETSEDGKSTKNYSFGEWLFCCLKILSWAPKNGKLAKYGLKHFWKNGKIIGFMSKEKLESLLKGTPTGTFIIRFPENMPDYIALYFYNSANSREKLLKQLLTIKDFNIKPLQDRILDSKLATNLFPNIEKEKAFTRMCKTDTSIVNGYFTVGTLEYIPSSVLQCMSNKSVEQSVSSPASSHSLLSNYYRYNAQSPAESFRSDNSSATGSYSSNYSPADNSSSSANLLENFSVGSLEGIDLQILLDDSDMSV